MSDQTTTIIKFNQFLLTNNYQGERESLRIEVIALLYNLLKKWSVANNTFDLWEKAESKDFGHIILIHEYAEATNINLQIAINKDGIHLEMSFANPENLQRMPNAFWKQFLEMEQYGNFMVTDNEEFSDEDIAQYPALAETTSGHLFRLMQKLIVFPMLHERQIDIGNLCVGWPFDQYSIKEVEERGTQAFDSMYCLNRWLTDGREELL